MRKAFVTLAVLILIGLIAWQITLRIIAHGNPAARQRGRLSVAVETEPIRKMTVRDVGSFTGTLYPAAQFIVAPKIAGRLEKLLVRIGDRVKKGQLIAVLEDDEYLQQVDQARAELQVAKANFDESRNALDTARRELERARVLRQKKITSESELDTVEAQFNAQDGKYKVAVAQVAQKEAALKAAQVRLSYTQIRATWEEGDENRLVGERFVDEGAMLAPNASIASVLDIHFIIGVIFVIERDYSKVRIGQRASISTDAYAEKIFPGKVVRVAPLIKETSREARVEIEIPNPEARLKPGMFIRVEIEFSRQEDATVVPFRALTKRGDRQGVFIADPKEKKAHFVPLRLGIGYDEWIQVIDPELSGSVVTLGQHMLEDGSAILLPGEKTPASSKEPAKAQKKGGEAPRKP